MVKLQKKDVTELNEVFEQAVYTIEGNKLDLLQLMGDVEVDEYIEEAEDIEELRAMIPVIGQYQRINVTFTPQLKKELEDWDSDARDIVELDEWLKYIPTNAEQLAELSEDQLYELVSIYLVDLTSYTTFEEPNILEGRVEITEG